MLLRTRSCLFGTLRVGSRGFPLMQLHSMRYYTSKLAIQSSSAFFDDDATVIMCHNKKPMPDVQCRELSRHPPCMHDDPATGPSIFARAACELDQATAAAAAADPLRSHFGSRCGGAGPPRALGRLAAGLEVAIRARPRSRSCKCCRRPRCRRSCGCSRSEVRSHKKSKVRLDPPGRDAFARDHG